MCFMYTLIYGNGVENQFASMKTKHVISTYENHLFVRIRSYLPKMEEKGKEGKT